MEPPEDLDLQKYLRVVAGSVVTDPNPQGQLPHLDHLPVELSLSCLFYLREQPPTFFSTTGYTYNIYICIHIYPIIGVYACLTDLSAPAIWAQKNNFSWEELETLLMPDGRLAVSREEMLAQTGRAYLGGSLDIEEMKKELRNLPDKDESYTRARNYMFRYLELYQALTDSKLSQVQHLSTRTLLVPKHTMFLFGSILHGQQKQFYRMFEERCDGREIHGREILFFRLCLDRSITEHKAFERSPIHGWNGSLLCGAERVDSQYCPFHMLLLMFGYHSMCLAAAWDHAHSPKLGIGEKAYKLLGFTERESKSGRKISVAYENKIFQFLSERWKVIHQESSHCSSWQRGWELREFVSRFKIISKS